MMVNKIQADVGVLVMRVLLGITFFAHGLSKFQNGIEGTGGFFASLGIPLPEVMAYVVAIVEAVGGILLAVGIGSRLIGAAFVVIMTVVMITLGYQKPFMGGYEFDLMLIAVSLFFTLSGDGTYSVRQFLAGRKRPADDGRKVRRIAG
ncbi:DoxX family protein [Paenibacillus methanolicus]|uniref:Putative membrane protein YphA (DoxX/SURF4 family) n=1 Tax=Paenibacillus methanolicus TaxID=582686 RepID=A0A5S5BWR8_9BACL|nr:DoxX family protein [Paenibacillus methanolicus]TYP70748.1 putative membrane protein YphA (DoxX/SURF4 family) [Paenibacillus methanolicus]